VKSRTYIVEVSFLVAASTHAVWQQVADVYSWRNFAGTKLEYQVMDREPESYLSYQVVSGLPTRDHTGRVELRETSRATTEIVWTERFRPRTPLTGGLLRTQIESHLVAAVRRIDEVVTADAPRSDL